MLTREQELVATLRKHAAWMQAPEVAPLVRVQLMDAAVAMTQAADAIAALDAESVRVPVAWIEYSREGEPIGATLEKPDGFWPFAPLYLSATPTSLPQRATLLRVCARHAKQKKGKR